MITEKIIRLRKRKGLTQTYMADYLKISRQAYSFYELGKYEMDFESLCKLADFFNVSTDYLLGRYDTNPFLLDTNDEIELVKKYRTLDERGKENVRNVTDMEHSRAPKPKKGEKPSAV